MGANSNFGLLIGNGLPFISASFGFGSNESTCDTPPCMNKKTTRFAVAGKCGCFGASGPAFDSVLAADSAAADPTGRRCQSHRRNGGATGDGKAWVDTSGRFLVQSRYRNSFSHNRVWQ